MESKARQLFDCLWLDNLVGCLLLVVPGVRIFNPEAFIGLDFSLLT